MEGFAVRMESDRARPRRHVELEDFLGALDDGVYCSTSWLSLKLLLDIDVLDPPIECHYHLVHSGSIGLVQGFDMVQDLALDGGPLID